MGTALPPQPCCAGRAARRKFLASSTAHPPNPERCALLAADESPRGTARSHAHTLRLLLLTLLPVLVLATGAVAFLGLRSYDPGEPPDQIRLSWSGDPHTTIVIVWHADRAASAAVTVSSGTTSRTVKGQ